MTQSIPLSGSLVIADDGAVTISVDADGDVTFTTTGDSAPATEPAVAEAAEGQLASSPGAAVDAPAADAPAETTSEQAPADPLATAKDAVISAARELDRLTEIGLANRDDATGGDVTQDVLDAAHQAVITAQAKLDELVAGQPVTQAS